VESCTAAVEHFDGQFEIIEWTKKLPMPATAASAEMQDARTDAKQSVEPV
jgi:hypothetical protein